MKARFDTTISLGSLVSMLALLGAIAGAWHSLDTRLTILELHAVESKADHARIDKLQDFMLTKNPDLLPLVGTKTKVTILELQALESKADHARIDKMQEVSTRTKVHEFGLPTPVLDLAGTAAADAAATPQIEKK